MHRSWDVSWGGELMLVDQDPGLLDGADAAGSEGFAAKMNALLLKLEKSPIAILPKPNRLVMVRSNTIHTITRVDAAAGESKRCTLTGFAYREDGENLSGANREEMEAAFLSSVR